MRILLNPPFYIASAVKHRFANEKYSVIIDFPKLRVCEYLLPIANLELVRWKHSNGTYLNAVITKNSAVIPKYHAINAKDQRKKLRKYKSVIDAINHKIIPFFDLTNQSDGDFLDKNDPRRKDLDANYSSNALADFMAARLGGSGAILDPSCGRGALLSAALKYSNVSESDLYGEDIDPQAIAYCKDRFPKGNFSLTKFEYKPYKK